MMDFMRIGGPAMWLTLLFGLVGLGYAIFTALRPAPRRMAFVKGIGLTVLGSTACALVSGTATVCYAISHRYADDPRWPLRFLEGMFEVLANGILGFGLLTLICLVGAVAARRLPEG